MSDTNKPPRRPHSKSARAGSRRPPRDPRAEDVVVPRDLVAELVPIERKVDALPARIATLETELARLKEEREADADEVASMLVRIAAAERAKTGAERRAELAEEANATGRAELATVRATLARATGLIEEIERREELTATMRARSLEEARRVLAGGHSKE